MSTLLDKKSPGSVLGRTVVPKSIRILIVEDQTLVRQGLVAMFNTESDIKVIGEVTDGAKAIDAALNLNTDVII